MNQIDKNTITSKDDLLKYNLDYTDKDIGKQFNEWTIIARIVNTRYVIGLCSCGKIKKIKKSNITLGYSKSCGHLICRNKLEKGTYGEWTVIEDNGGTFVKCRCSCGKEKYVRAINLRNGVSKSCGHVESFNGKIFGYWKVLDDFNNGYAFCNCVCGKISIKRKADLTNGHTKSCGCMKGNIKSNTSNNSIIGLKFGALTVINDYGYGNIECKCICGSIRNYNKYSVTSGHTSSCGCIRNELRYINRWGNTRSKEQIDACRNEDALAKFILNKFSSKPTLLELSHALNISYSRTVTLITDKNRRLIHYHPAISKMEKQIVCMVESILEKK